jgi:hypothetical protein
MRMKLSSLVRLVIGSALALAYWRLTGRVGVAVAWVGATMILVPTVLIYYGRKLGDPILSGFFGGGLGFALWAVGWGMLGPQRLMPSVMFVLVPIGMIMGGFYGLMLAFRDRVLARRPRMNLRLAYLYALVLMLFLIAAIASGPVIDEVRWVILDNSVLSGFL